MVETISEKVLETKLFQCIIHRILLIQRMDQKNVTITLQGLAILTFYQHAHSRLICGFLDYIYDKRESGRDGIFTYNKDQGINIIIDSQKLI